MKQTIFVPRERDPKEPRVVMTPATAAQFKDLGLRVLAEAGLGQRAGFQDADYAAAGVQWLPMDSDGYAEANIVLRLTPPDNATLARYRPGTLQVSFLDPFNEPEQLDRLASAGVNAISLELIPRTTLAQKMDVLSSQANLAGYAAVIQAAHQLDKILPMMMTPAGTIQPARCFVLGVGVAGLQAIATAKRLGAQVEAYDTRPVVEEQVRSLGGKFLKIDLGELGQTEQGYARALSDEQLKLQRRALAKACSRADIVITTAKLFGRSAPMLVDAEALAAMQPGSVVIDLAAESGGNVTGSVCGRTVVTANGVRIIGPAKAERDYPTPASNMLAANYYHLLAHFWQTTEGCFAYRLDDPILKGALLTHEGKIIHPNFANKLINANA